MLIPQHKINEYLTLRIEIQFIDVFDSLLRTVSKDHYLRYQVTTHNARCRRDFYKTHPDTARILLLGLNLPVQKKN